MRAIVFAILGAIILLGVASTQVSADSGTFTHADGVTCTWFGGGSLYTLSCSGYSVPRMNYVNYTCDVTIFGMSQSWTCRDMLGGSWSGSR